MIRKALISLFSVAVLLLTACGANETPVDMDALRQSMADAAPSAPEMLCLTDADTDARELFSHWIDMDYNKVEHFFLLYAADGNADEIAVIRLHSTADTAEAQRFLQEHLTGRARLYEQYRPDQLRRVEQAEIFTRGRYAALILCDEQEAVKAAFQRTAG